MTASKATCDALAPLLYPVYDEDSKPAEEYLPETYLTYFIVGEQPAREANNRIRDFNTRVQVSMWSTDPAKTQGARDTITGTMEAAGFLFVNCGRIPFNNGRYGWRGDYRIYIKKE